MSNLPAGMPLNQTDFTDNIAWKSADYFAKAIKPISDTIALLDYTQSEEKEFDLTPYLQGTWVAFGSTYGPPTLTRQGNRVYMNGLVKSGGSGNICSGIPAAYCPTTSHYYLATCGGPGATRIFISAAGNMGISAFYTGGTDTYVELDGFTWTTD